MFSRAMLPLHLCVLTKNNFQKKGQISTKVLMRICFLDHNVIDIMGDGEFVSIFEILARIIFVRFELDQPIGRTGVDG